MSRRRPATSISTKGAERKSGGIRGRRLDLPQEVCLVWWCGGIATEGVVRRPDRQAEVSSGRSTRQRGRPKR